MTDINIAFCRRLLTEGLKVVRQHFPNVRNKDAWVWDAGRDHWEFHGPEQFYWHGRAGNAYDARYKGWMAWLEHKGVDDKVEQPDRDNQGGATPGASSVLAEEC